MAILYWLQFYLKKLLLGDIKLIKNTDPDKYSYSGCGISFDMLFHFPVVVW